MALVQAAPGSAAIGHEFVELFERRLTSAGVEVRFETEAETEMLLDLEPDAVVVATGARPFVPDLALDGVEVMQAWDVLALGAPRSLRAVVADWGGDPSGLDVAEVLALAGNEVTLAVQAVTAGEPVHSYRRNLYLQRLYRAGVTIVQHHALAGASVGEVELSNVFAPELSVRIPADLLVLAQGRVPVDELGQALVAARIQVEEAGDCRSPRSLEEAVLEGTLAARRMLALA